MLTDLRSLFALRPLLFLCLLALAAGCPEPDDDDSALLLDDDDVTSDDDDSTADDDDVTPDDDDATADDDDVTPDDDDATADDDDVTPDDDDATADDDDATADDDDATTNEIVRFIAMGDTGEGFADQNPNSLVIETVCANAGGCDFVLLMGDNFYDVGVDSVTDPQWDDKFEDPYANLDLPFYPTLGNHDGGLFGTGAELWKGDIQVDYTNYSDKWTMPGRYYKHSWGNADFYALDTSSIFFNGLDFLFNSYEDLTTQQANFLAAEWAGASTGLWRIAYGHHPYLSNGPHGNAGTYEGVPGVPYVSGGEIKDFLEANVCGEADLYIDGHDHSRQILVDTCDGTRLIVSGAGAKTSDIEGTNPVEYEDADTPGFFFFEIDGNTITVQAWDETGAMNYETLFTK